MLNGPDTLGHDSRTDWPRPSIADADDNNCDEHAACTNTGGSFTCECSAGWHDISHDDDGRYDHNGTSCEDIDECAGPPPPVPRFTF